MGFVLPLLRGGLRLERVSGRSRAVRRPKRWVVCAVDDADAAAAAAKDRDGRYYEYFERFPDSFPMNPAKWDGWLLIFGSEMGMWKNNLLEAGIPMRDVHSIFVPDVQLEHSLKRKLEFVFILVLSSPKEDVESFVSLQAPEGNVLLTFEGPAEATRYALQLEANGFPLPRVKRTAVQFVIDHVRERDMFRGIIPENTILQPPQPPQ